MRIPAVNDPAFMSSGRRETENAETEDVLGFKVFTLAIGMEPHEDDTALFHQYGRLRGRVYAKERCLIPLSALSDEGTEYDSDDPRSIHLVATRKSDGVDAVVGSLRMIVRGAADWTDSLAQYLDAGLRPSLELLPAESFYPEVRPDIDLRDSAMTCEYSRYIARHPNKAINARITQQLHLLAIQHIVNLGLPTSLAVVEESIERHLSRSGLSVDRVSESRYLDEYCSVNHVVRVNVAGMAPKLGVTEKPLSELLPARRLPVGRM